jgi:hypothetical protein
MPPSLVEMESRERLLFDALAVAGGDAASSDAAAPRLRAA